VRSGRQAVEEKEEKRKDEKKREETRKKQGLTFGLCSILSANKICRTEEMKVQKTRRKRGDRNRERREEKGLSLWIPEARKQKLCPSARKSSLAFRTSRDLQTVED
jgi:hypothetical protein